MAASQAHSGAESDTAAAQHRTRSIDTSGAKNGGETGSARPIQPEPARLPGSSQSRQTLPVALPIRM